MVGMCWSHWNRATLNSNNNINNRTSCRILFEFPITALVRDCLKWTFLKNGKRRKCTSTKTKATVKELQSSSQAICTIPYNRNVLHTNVRKLFGEIETKEKEIVPLTKELLEIQKRKFFSFQPVIPAGKKVQKENIRSIYWIQILPLCYTDFCWWMCTMYYTIYAYLYLVKQLSVCPKIDAGSRVLLSPFPLTHTHTHIATSSVRNDNY